MAVNVSQLVAEAARHLGKRYVFGSAGPNTFDCSGLTQYVFKKQGVNLPHHSADQAKMGTAVSKSDIRAGDLVFSTWGGEGPYGHVGLAVGPHTIINAPHTGAVVRYQELTPGYMTHVTAVRRISNDGGSGLGDALGGALSGAGGALASPFAAVSDAIKEAGRPLTSIGKVSEGIFKVFMPSNFIRVVSGVFGFVFIAWGVLLLSKEVRNG